MSVFYVAAGFDNGTRRRYDNVTEIRVGSTASHVLSSSIRDGRAE
jgi:hypothetical protein